MDTVVLLLNKPEALRARIGVLFAQLRAQDADAAKELLGELCEEPAGPRLSPRYGSGRELWVCGDGRRMRIGKMVPEHLGHSLAMIMRRLRENPLGKWVLGEHGQIKFVRPARDYPELEDRWQQQH